MNLGRYSSMQALYNTQLLCNKALLVAHIFSSYLVPIHNGKCTDSLVETKTTCLSTSHVQRPHGLERIFPRSYRETFNLCTKS